ncbi:MAG: hypothetical protein AB7V46_19555 [Thermomicrobiales bacterium]
MNSISTTSYGAAGNAVVTVDALGGRTTFGYDAASRPVSTKNAVGAITTAVYDNRGERVVTVDPLGKRTTFGYDAAGNQVRIVNPLGLVTIDWPPLRKPLRRLTIRSLISTMEMDCVWNAPALQALAGSPGTGRTCTSIWIQETIS